MFAERVKEILSCGKIWKEKQTICLSFPYFKHKMMILYYEVALFQGETDYHGRVGGLYFQNPAENIWFCKTLFTDASSNIDKC